MYDLETLDQSRIGDFATLICPEGRAQLEQLPPQTAVVGVLARLRDQAVGLALSGVYPRSGSAWVISLYVDPASRNQGLGTALLGKSEEEVKKRECLKTRNV